jgi:hypothetical protein
MTVSIGLLGSILLSAATMLSLCYRGDVQKGRAEPRPPIGKMRRPRGPATSSPQQIRRLMMMIGGYLRHPRSCLRDCRLVG